MTENTIAVKQTTQLSTPIQTKRGLEDHIDREDLIIPRAKLLQSKSPEVEEEVFRQLNLKSGMIINSLTKKELPKKFIPIFRFVNWIRFNPRDKKNEGFDPAFEPGQIIWRSSDPHDPRVVQESSFGPNGEKPLAIKIINFLSYFPGVEMPVILSFAKTSFRAGKELTSLAKFTPGGEIFSRKYGISSKQEKNDQGTYNVLVVSQLGEKECVPTDQEFKVAESWYNDFSRRVDEIKVHSEEETE